ncbi:MAG: DNA repair protein RecN [Rhizobiaceae bacterium]|nr:DNA repair protein RecN [Rhizobiaceae bacterium]
MLVSLSIRDIVLIDALTLDFEPGLSVLTGETGAGKSILLDALSLALGARGDAGRVRDGAAQGQVTAVFDVPMHHAARAILAENGIEAEGDIILRRVQTADGRARVFVNDAPASVGLMRMLGALLVEIHGQHDDRALVDPAAHRALLDAHGGLAALTADVRARHQAWRAVTTEAKAHGARMQAALRDAEYLRAAHEELTRLAPAIGEETQLAEKRAAMMRAEKAAAEVRDAEDVIAGVNSPIPQLAALHRRLARKGGEGGGLMEPVLQALEAALNELDRVQSAVDQAMRAAAFDPRALEQAEERLFAIRAAARKYNVLPDDLAKAAARFAADLAAIDSGEAEQARLDKAVRETRAAFDAAALVLSARRAEAARALEAAVHAELPSLKLETAAFIVQITTDVAEPSPDGIDTVEFWVRTNPGTKAGPMMKVASGGELSRFLLALKVALAEKGTAPTLVFDEIDTGVGGAVADAIGSRLARLARSVQVLSVTHAPQVAARADHHFLIAKGADGQGGTRTSVHQLQVEKRREEIARMLAGATITEEARAAAVKLLDAAAGA